MKDKKQAAAVLLMLLISIPLLLVYGSFFKMAFQDNQGSFTLNNFEFLFKSITLKQTVVQPIINPLKNTVLFTVIVTISEVLLSSMAGYAISRMDFKGKRIIIE